MAVYIDLMTEQKNLVGYSAITTNVLLNGLRPVAARVLDVVMSECAGPSI